MKIGKVLKTLAIILSICIVVGIGLAVKFIGNRDLLDTTWTFNKAIIITGAKAETVEIKQWKDYKTEHQRQITTKDGKVYLGDTATIILLNDK